MSDILFPPLAIAECGFFGEFGCIPTTYGTKTSLRTLEWEREGTRHTRHGVFTKEVVDLTSRELLNFPMSIGHLNEEGG